MTTEAQRKTLIRIAKRLHAEVMVDRFELIAKVKPEGERGYATKNLDPLYYRAVQMGFDAVKGYDGDVTVYFPGDEDDERLG